MIRVGDGFDRGRDVDVGVEWPEGIVEVEDYEFGQRQRVSRPGRDV